MHKDGALKPGNKKQPHAAYYYLILWEKRLFLHRPPGSHLRFKVHQAKGFLCPQIMSEPARRFVATVPALNVSTKHSATQKQEAVGTQVNNV